MFNFPAALLWIPSMANGYVAALILQFSWQSRHGAAAAQADFELAMFIAAVSLPIACLMAVGLTIWAAMRFAVRHSIGARIHVRQLTVSALNVAAPFLFWFFLKRIAG